MSGRTEGALYELVSRGEKDKYYIKDDGISPFAAKYDQIAGSLSETRLKVPTNAPVFGRSLEFEIDCFADILVDAALIVELPPLLPSELPLIQGTLGPAADSLAINTFRDSSGYVYGYSSGAAYYLFERIQVFQDKILIQDITGDSLQALASTTGSYGSGLLSDRVAGCYNEADAAAVCRSSVPEKLRIKLPLPGCQTAVDCGFPICALRDIGSSVWRLRLVLRKLDDLLVAVDSSGGTVRGSGRLPYNKALTAIDINGQTISCVALAKEQMRVGVYLETTQQYVAEETQKKLRAEPVEIPFRLYFDQEHIFGPGDYNAVIQGGTSTITKRLEGRHPVERIVFFFRLIDDIMAGRREPYVGAFSSLKFLVASQEREFEWEPAVWSTMEQLVKTDRVRGGAWRNGIYQMNWSLGQQHEKNAAGGPRKPAPRQPEGAVQFSTADKPSFQVTLTAPPVGYKPQSQLQICCEAWVVYVIKDGRAHLMFAN